MSELWHEKAQREARERQAEFTRLQERRDDERKRDQTERQRRSDAAKAQTEAERHNRALESARYSGEPAHQEIRRYADETYPPQRKRRGGKLIALLLLVIGVLYFWPQLASIVNKTEVDKAAYAPPDEETIIPVESQQSAEIPVVEEAVPTPPPAKEYPPCSATVTDQCQQGS